MREVAGSGPATYGRAVERFEDRLRVRELMRGGPSADDVDQALTSVTRSPEQFEHPAELAAQLRLLRAAPGEALLLRCRGLLPPVSRAERAAMERQRTDWAVEGVAEGAHGLGGE